MKAILLIALPFAFAAVAAAWPGERTRPWLLPLAGLVHAALVIWMLIEPPPFAAGDWLAFDPLARAVLPAVSLLFLACAAYAVS